jgi:hypothetical protein
VNYLKKTAVNMAKTFFDGVDFERAFVKLALGLERGIVTALSLLLLLLLL